MKLTAEQAYSVLGVIGNTILSKSGSVCIGFRLYCPECYTLDTDGIQRRHNDFFRAFKYMPPDTIVHKQDVFTRAFFDASRHIPGDSFKGVSFHPIKNFVDSTEMFKYVSIIADYVKEIKRQRIEFSKTNGRTGGRPPGLSLEAITKASAAKELYLQKSKGKYVHPVSDICKFLNISKKTLYKYLSYSGVSVGKRDFKK